MRTTHRTLVLALLVTGGLAAGAARASDVYFHRELTESILKDRGWENREAIESVVQANIATDMARFPKLGRNVLGVIFPTTESRMDAVNLLAETAPFTPRSTVGFHFNSLYSFDDIDRRWLDFGVWVDEQSAAVAGDRRTELILLGLVAHHVQDFYAHANWVGTLDLFTPGELKAHEFPTWEELIHNQDDWISRHPEVPAAAVVNRFRASNAWISPDEELGGLQTGRIRNEVVLGADPWMHRHHEGRTMDVNHRLATRAIHHWFDRVEAGFAAAHTARIAEE